MDWYVSNASRLYAVRGSEITAEGAAINGGSQYLPLTDGSYHPLFERIVLNVSSHFEEVLPAIPNPPSPYKERLQQTVFASYFTADAGKESWPNALAHLRELRALGVTHLFVRTHEEAWRDGAKAIPSVWMPHPAKVETRRSPSTYAPCAANSVTTSPCTLTTSTTRR